jgi:hypothetical protein
LRLIRSPVHHPIGVFYARLYVGGRSKWISLKTKSFPVAKLELLKHLKAHYVVADAEARTQHGKATVGDLATIYLQGESGQRRVGSVPSIAGVMDTFFPSMD